MKSLFIFIIFCLSSILSHAQLVIYEQNFDRFHSGTMLGAATTEWDSWSGSIDDDVIIKPGISISPDQSMELINNNDIYFIYNNVTSGIYKTGFSVFVVQGAGFYFNVEHDVKSNYAFELWLDDLNQIQFKNGTDSLQLGTYMHENWHRIELEINLDADSVKILWDSVQVGQFQFSLSIDTTDLNQLGILNFYGLSSIVPAYNISHTHCFIDDFKFEKLVGTGVPDVEKREVNVFPNPCVNSVQIDIPSHQDLLSIRMVNSIGKEVWVMDGVEIPMLTLDFPYPQGLYHVILQYADGTSHYQSLVKGRR